MFDSVFSFVIVIQATGGSGNYTWSSSVPEVATVTVSGQVVTSRLTGETQVKAADSKNHAHFDTMRVISIDSKIKKYFLKPDEYLPLNI